MGNEGVSKQNGVEALCGDCNTLEEIGRFPWIPRDLADSAAQILEEGNPGRVHGAQSLIIIITLPKYAVIIDSHNLQIPEGTSINYSKSATQVAFVYLSTLKEL